MESRVYRDKEDTLRFVSAPTVSVVVFGWGSVGGAPLPLEIFGFGLVVSRATFPDISSGEQGFSRWQRAVNRQPSFRSGNSKGRSPPAILFLKI